MKNRFFTNDAIQAVPEGTVVDKIIHHIRQDIASGRYTMGHKLPTEFELMEELHVSRNSLREAIKILVTVGIVEIRRGDGTYICSEIQPNITDFMIYSMLLEDSSTEEVIELRQILDEDILEMAILKATDADIDHLQERIYEMRACFEQGNLSLASRLDYGFHLELAKACHNKFLSRIVSSVYSLFEGSIANNIHTEEQFAKADRYHQEMIDCLRIHDASQVKNVIRNSLSSWRANVERHQ